MWCPPEKVPIGARQKDGERHDAEGEYEDVLAADGKNEEAANVTMDEDGTQHTEPCVVPISLSLAGDLVAAIFRSVSSVS